MGERETVGPQIDQPVGANNQQQVELVRQVYTDPVLAEAFHTLSSLPPDEPVEAYIPREVLNHFTDAGLVGAEGLTSEGLHVHAALDERAKEQRRSRNESGFPRNPSDKISSRSLLLRPRRPHESE